MKHKLLRAAIATTLALDAGAALAEAPFSFASTPGKLPKDVLPVQYAAHIVPDIAANTFRGNETVEIDVARPTSSIMLNADKLDIDGATLSGKGLDRVALSPRYDREQQTVTFALARPLKPGRYRLAMQFSGLINREARGMFYMNYKANGADRRMIATTMEPTDARRLLPSWDEPAFRAKFRLSIDVPANFIAYSNMPVERRQMLPGGKERYAFALSPKMPSYLVSLAAGELERVSARQDGVDIGVVTVQGKQGYAQVPLEDAKAVLQYYNKYFGVPYPLPKLDLVAVPGGFNGAMENWGNIVYNESALLVDPAKSPDSVKKGTFGVNAHEIAHQWFGNLVTMAWWDNQLGWDEKPGDSGEDKRLRGLLASALARAGDPEAIEQARQRFARYLDDPASVSPAMIDFVIGTAGRFAVQHRDELMKNYDAVSRNRAFADVVASSSNPAHADMMEEYVRQNFGPDELVEAQRVGNGIRISAAQKARLLPQVGAALK
jgi:aminopeptidase N